MLPPTFWNPTNAADGMLRLNTPGDQENAAHRNLHGAAQGAQQQPSNGGAITSGTVLAGGGVALTNHTPATAAERVYPTFDGVRNSMPPGARPMDFGTPPYASFPTWHSSYQAEFINSRAPAEFAFPDGASTANATAFFMLDTSNRPVNLKSMTLGEYAKLTELDKSNFNPNLAALNVLSTLGLETSKTTANDAINGLASSVRSLANLDAGNALIGAENTRFTPDDALVFLRQTTLLSNAVNNTFAIATDKILQEVAEITKRFERILHFANTLPQVQLTTQTKTMQGATFVADWNDTETETFMHSRVNSLDNNATIDQGLAEFKRAERTIVEMKERRAAIAENSQFRDPNLDVPNLIYKLQLLYEAEAEGVADSGTEEIRQLHKLLQDYAVMQQMINKTIQAFDPSKSGDLRRFMNIGGKTDGSVHDEQFLEERALVDDVESYTRTYEGSTVSGTLIDRDDYLDKNASIFNPDETDIPRLPLYHWSLLFNTAGTVGATNRDLLNTNNPSSPPLASERYQEGETGPLLTAQQALSFSMFAEVGWAGHYGRRHPIEEVFGAPPRPTFDFIDTSKDGVNSLKLHSKSGFDSFQTTLSEMITILNQQNQIKQNEIESATKQQNRHFELGNNALRKMNDLLLSIGRM